MTLSDDDIRAIIARAEELQRGAGLPHDEAESLVLAGEQLGISRAAMEGALRERLGSRVEAAPGELVFARSADDKFYAAEVVAVSDQGYRVRFLRGGERVLAAHELRACPFLPGDRVTCNWPGWGTWTAKVLGYDAEARALTLSDGWQSAVFPVSEVWLVPQSAERKRRRRINAALLGAGALLGAAVTALLQLVLS